MSEEDEKERARDYVERVKESSLAKAPQHQRAEMAAYWQSRAGMFRALARNVIRAALAGRDEPDALAWSVGEFGKDLNSRSADGSQFRAFQRWAGRREAFLFVIARQIWKEILREEPPNDGFYVALEAHPNDDYEAGDYLARVRIPLRWQAVLSLEDATKQVRRYIESHSLGSGNWVGRAGQVARYGKPWVRVSYNGRIWQGWNWDSKQEVDLTGNPLPAPSTEPAHPTTNQSFKFEVLAQGGWSSNAQRYETEEQARAAGKSLSLRWTAVEDYRVVPSTDPPNQPTSEPPPAEKPAAPPAASDKKILFIHVGDKPSKPTEPIPSSDEEVVLRYSVEIRGRWGRKRTDGFMSVDIVKRVDPKKPLPTETLLTMMNNKLAELKVMPGAVVKLIEQPWTVSRTGVERTSLLSGRTVHTETVK